MAMKLLEACLPRRKDDSDTGELKFRAYRKCLSHLSKPQLFWTVEQAIKRQRFFPTVRELLDIAAEWASTDDDAKAQRLARRLAAREANRRHIASTRTPGPSLEEMLETMAPELISLGLKLGHLIKRDGKVIVSPEPEATDR
ncbi:hypothetical protein OIK40_14420 [Erythrobacter sp. sf7]|uniref:Uncharacterized protein n=1 Tax=Erythrobacter fulvus TaxID=2987523 RepID=A0ABT5JSU8_9SPHN|nr:hypothetical protein [Erythrobacter fulvus]MDC8755840.1 hypothetical protein [Erythrobacter fulvus]